MYPKVWWYRGAAVLDLFGRVVWLATVVPPNAFGSHLTSYIPDYLTPILALAELARRCVWGFFRLEHEHLSNAFQHRREGQFVPSHLRTLRPRKAPKRVLSVVETGFIAALVIACVEINVTAPSRRRHDVDATRFLESWPGVVFFSILSCFRASRGRVPRVLVKV